MTEFNDLSSLPRYLASRRSGRPRDMIAPGPDAAQIREIVEMALRTPDHGKLNPWRVVHVASDQRDAFAEKLTSAYRADKPEAGRLEIEAMETPSRARFKEIARTEGLKAALAWRDGRLSG